MGRQRIRFCFVAAIILFTTTIASAAFDYTSQNRFVFGSLGGSLGGPPPQTFTAPDFNPFIASTNLSAEVGGGAANQRQQSHLFPNLISVSGTSACIRPAQVGTGVANTRSFFDVAFNLVDETNVTLAASGSASSNGGGVPIHEIRLTSSSTTLIYWHAFNSGTLFPQSNGSRSTDLTLPAGTYHLIVDMQSADSGFISQNHYVPSFNVTLAIPEPATLGLLALAALPLLRRRRRTC